MFNAMRLYRGNATQHESAPIIQCTQLSVDYLAVLLGTRAKDLSAAARAAIVDTVVAANSTYPWLVDAPIHLMPGNTKFDPLAATYYWELDLLANTALTGYSTAPTSLTTQVLFQPLWDGHGVQGDDYIRLATLKNLASFSLSSVDKLLLACSGTELSTVISELVADATYTNAAVIQLEDIADSILNGVFTASAVSGSNGAYFARPIEDPVTTANALYTILRDFPGTLPNVTVKTSANATLIAGLQTTAPRTRVYS